jgi:hypothetical protein
MLHTFKACTLIIFISFWQRTIIYYIMQIEQLRENLGRGLVGRPTGDQSLCLNASGSALFIILIALRLIECHEGGGAVFSNLLNQCFNYKKWIYCNFFMVAEMVEL